MDCASYHLSQVTPQFTWGSLHEGNWSISMCVLCRRWRRSSPGSCRNRKCSSRWAASRSALIPPPRPASPSSIRSPASSPPASRGQRRLHTHGRTDGDGEDAAVLPLTFDLWQTFPLFSIRIHLKESSCEVLSPTFLKYFSKQCSACRVSAFKFS